MQSHPSLQASRLSTGKRMKSGGVNKSSEVIGTLKEIHSQHLTNKEPPTKYLPI